MHHRQAGKAARLRGRHRRVGVALDEHGRGALPGELLAELLDDPADLPVPRLAADAGQGMRGGQARGGEEHAGQFLVGMLAGMHEPRPRAQHARNMGELYYFRAGANHDGYITGRGIIPHNRTLNWTYRGAAFASTGVILRY